MKPELQVALILSVVSCVLIACNYHGDNGLDDSREEVINCGGYHYNLREMSPIEFLKLRRRGLGEFGGICSVNFLAVCDPISGDWIKIEDIPILITYLDSNEVIAIPVYSAIASFALDNRGKSTMAREAYYLIQAYRYKGGEYGDYPPYCTIPLGGSEFETFKLEDSLKMDVLEWWKGVMKDN